MSEQPRTFGAELRRLRVAAGLSLAELAKLVHYNKGYLGKIENGDKPAGSDLARRCDAALDANGVLTSLIVQQTSPSTRPIEIEDDGEGGFWSASSTVLSCGTWIAVRPSGTCDAQGHT